MTQGAYELINHFTIVKQYIYEKYWI